MVLSMTTAAKSILIRAAEMLHDAEFVRWTIPEMVQWLNDGQREIITHRPDALSASATVTLAAGSRQSLDAMALTPRPLKLLQCIRNVAPTSKKRALRLVQRHVLDALAPGWSAMTGVVDVVHYMFDEREPRAFYVYPPATTVAQIEILYSAYPVDIAAPLADGIDAVLGDVGLPDIFANALLDYVLYRAHSKDAEYAANGGMAAAHYSAFANAIGIEVQATAATKPRPRPGAEPGMQ